MKKSKPTVGVLKALWKREGDAWVIHDMKGVDIDLPTKGNSRFFKCQGEVQLMTSHPPGDIHSVLSSFGTADFLLKQSIVPVVALILDKRIMKCIGTASIISCSGYLLTAAHVLLDPVESGYGKVTKKGQSILIDPSLSMGVLIPIGAGYGVRGYRYFPFRQSRYWGSWTQSPLLHEPERFNYSTDIAICKINEMREGSAHQPLSLSLRRFALGETAYAFGYAEMPDAELEVSDGTLVIPDVAQDLYISIGQVLRFASTWTNRLS